VGVVGLILGILGAIGAFIIPGIIAFAIIGMKILGSVLQLLP